MNEAEIIRSFNDLPGVVTLTASKENGAPEVAWGDSFFFYDPENAGPENRRFPFATIVIKDYPGFDMDSKLDRPGIFRLNLAIGRDRFTELFGFPPAQFAERRAEFDFAAVDRIIPHPVYANQGWMSVLVPGDGSEAHVKQLIVHAYERARGRYRRRRGTVANPGQGTTASND
jgi:Family of unknown function (DUF6194)